MPKIIYNRSYRRISNQARRALDAAQIGKNPDKCFVHFDSASKTLLIGTPYNIGAAIECKTVQLLAQLVGSRADYVAPIAMPRAC
ncbi:MAG: hypothetical protein V3R25_10005 [Nitrosomonadaceae bacterium]